MTHRYPTCDELVAAGYPPQPLDIPLYYVGGIARADRPPSRVTPEKRRHVKNDARVFVSRYVGVTRVQGCYVAQWRNERGTYSRGTRRPDTPEGELQAAQDYAAATGRTVEERETPRVTSQDGESRG